MVVYNLGIKHAYGRLWHYGHFIHDFIMPVLCFMDKNNITPKSDVILRIDTPKPDDKLGTFHDLAEKLTGLKIVQVERFNRSEKVYMIPSENFGPYSEPQFRMINDYVDKWFAIPDCSADIILIRRGVQPLMNGSFDTGANRRTLTVQEELSAALQAQHGDRFKEVVLEGMSIEEQISVFKHARVIIGIHGAGLCNIIWNKNPDCTIVEIEPILVQTFKHMAAAKKIKYVPLKEDLAYIVQAVANACA